MGKFNWWRRHSKHKPITKHTADKRKSLLVQKIENNDFSLSPFWADMRLEKMIAYKAEREINESSLSTESKQDKIRVMWAKQMKRYNKLAEDFMKDEHNRLQELKMMFIKEFNVDVWEEALSQCEGDEKELYVVYRNLVTLVNS